jgi:ParB-like chromosome segregation protein Spo0J
MEMVIRKIKTDEINYAPYNPRKIDKETYNKLVNSIKRWGLVQPIIVNLRTKNVVGGNQRLKVLRDLNIQEVDAVIVDMSLEEEKALNIALNKIGGEWDLNKLSEIFKSLDTNLSSFTGFSIDEINVLRADDLNEIKVDVQMNSIPNSPVERKNEYTIKLVFKSRESANDWLEEHGYNKRISEEERSIKIRLEG